MPRRSRAPARRAALMGRTNRGDPDGCGTATTRDIHAGGPRQGDRDRVPDRLRDHRGRGQLGGFGLDAPASVYFVGLTFTFRDGLRERLGFKGALLAIAIGGILSYILEIRQDGDLFARIALASAAAFAVSEFADAVVYERIREYSRLLGIIGSNTVGLVVDSALFLTLAFGSLEFLTGQVVGKFYMTVLAIILIVAWERGRRLRAATA